MFNTSCCAFFFCDISLAGSPVALHSSDQHVCQCLPHDAVRQRHLDTIFNLDGSRYSTYTALLSSILYLSRVYIDISIAEIVLTPKEEILLTWHLKSWVSLAEEWSLSLFSYTARIFTDQTHIWQFAYVALFCHDYMVSQLHAGLWWNVSSSTLNKTSDNEFCVLDNKIKYIYC